jgi:membrane associated rhomboid family serine protease
VVFVIFLLVLAVLGYRATTAEQRAHFARAAIASLRHAIEIARRKRPDTEPFWKALDARTPRALATRAIVALNAGVFVMMLVSPGALADPDTLVRWGAVFGPRTTNGEWWRLLTAIFVQPSPGALLVNTIGLYQVGRILERLIGQVAFVAAYISAGLLANLVILATAPVAVTAGASSAVLGMYGVLVASFAAGMLRQSGIAIPLRVVTRLVPAAVIFFVSTLGADEAQILPELTGFAAGSACGAGLAIGVRNRKPPMYRVAATAAATVIIAVSSAVPLRGVADVRPELERVLALEDRTARTYQASVEQFRKDRISAGALVQQIDKNILPELRAERARLEAIDGVPREHKPLVTAAEDYFHLREESWRLRAEGLRGRSMLKLREAEQAERASLEALRKIQSATDKS